MHGLFNCILICQFRRKERDSSFKKLESGLEGAVGLREKLMNNLLCLMPISFYNSSRLKEQEVAEKNSRKNFHPDWKKAAEDNHRKIVHM